MHTDRQGLSVGFEKISAASDGQHYLAPHKALALITEGDRADPKRPSSDRLRPCFEAIIWVATVPEGNSGDKLVKAIG
ncbi:hypothetical protein H6G00_18660 [Leptolyngbya sp. FACHB-541]|uniref:hypothetical protein n=1 Tax=Leptolyngbya sp. FACHB-541 TaxID=2692810 RepID=UPI001687E2C3|nr:hypothetical protein [Leptolyngbya sp. FACHB-541]MBD1998622.1 hypothetical protein [Leptolyngbya sp. FACHB-541]